MAEKENVKKKKVAQVQKRTRAVRTKSTLSLRVDSSEVFKKGSEKFYPFSRVTERAKEKLDESTRHRLWLNKRLGKYNISEIMGIPMISVDSPMATDNCSVVIKFNSKE